MIPVVTTVKGFLILLELDLSFFNPRENFHFSVSPEVLKQLKKYFWFLYLKVF